VDKYEMLMRLWREWHWLRK